MLTTFIYYLPVYDYSLDILNYQKFVIIAYKRGGGLKKDKIFKRWKLIFEWWGGPESLDLLFFPVDQQKNKEHSNVRFNQVSPLIMASQDLPVRFDSLAKKGISFISYPVKWMGKADQPM